MQANQEHLGPYRLVRRLRDVQVGQSFLGTRRGPDGFEKRVVIRCTGREQLPLLVGEANRAARLSHAGIAHVLDVGTFQDLAYVVSEHALGVTLRDLVQREGRLLWAAAARVISEAAAALAYAHARRDQEGRLLGLVHRRIAPQRIFVGGHEARSPVCGPQGALSTVKIAGMGTSWAWPDAQCFRSPEETRGEPVDGRADVFALGLILEGSVDREGASKLATIIDRATAPLQEERYTSRELDDALRHALREARPTPPAEAAKRVRSLRR